MIDSYLKNNTIKNCDTFEEDEICKRDRLKMTLDGKILGRTKTAAQRKYELNGLKKTLKTAVPSEEDTKNCG